MTRLRAKQVELEGRKLTGTSADVETYRWASGLAGGIAGDWVVQGVLGGFILYRPNLFAATFEILPDTPVEPPPNPPGAGGSTGPATDRTNLSFTATNGKTSKYHAYASGVTQPAGLVLQFHGDAAYEFRNPASSYSLGGSNGIIAQARSRGFITVPVLAPDTRGVVTWWEDGAGNAVFVRDLLAKLKAEYGIKNDGIWLVGYSGGAQFITQFYLPAHSSTIDGGGAVIFGGGGTPRVSAQPFASSLTGNFPMHWYTGARDDGSSGSYNAMRDAKAGEAWYASQGFATSHEYPAGVGHALDGKFGRVVGQCIDSRAPRINR